MLLKLTALWLINLKKVGWNWVENIIAVDVVSKPNITKLTALSKVMINSKHPYAYYSICIRIGLYESKPGEKNEIQIMIVPLYAYRIGLLRTA